MRAHTALPTPAPTVCAAVLSAHTQMGDSHSVETLCVFTSTCSYAHTQFLKPAQAHTNMHTLLSLIHAQKHLLFTFSGTKEDAQRDLDRLDHWLRPMV